MDGEAAPPLHTRFCMEFPLRGEDDQGGACMRLWEEWEKGCALLWAIRLVLSLEPERAFAGLPFVLFSFIISFFPFPFSSRGINVDIMSFLSGSLR